MRIVGIIVLGAAIVFAGNLIGANRLLGRIGRFNIPFSASVSRVRAAAMEWMRIYTNASAHSRRADAAEEQARALLKENTRLQEFELENVRLRAELDFFERTQYPLAVARVIGQIRENGVTFFVIGRGSGDGIEVGAPAIADGAIVGKVAKTQSAISIVAPLDAPRFKTAAVFPGSTGTAGIIEGLSAGGYIMRLIPKDIAIHEGMAVITSGLEPLIPRGLIIGTLERIETGEENLYQEAYVVPPVRNETISLVSVLLPVGAK